MFAVWSAGGASVVPDAGATVWFGEVITVTNQDVEAADRLKVFCLLPSCDVYAAKAITACARAQEVEWDDARCRGWCS